MGATEDIENKLAGEEVTQIVGQPSKQAVTLLTKELVMLVRTVKTKLEDGKHGHIQLVIVEVSYRAISHENKAFDIPSHSGIYPSTVLADATTRKKKSQNTKLKYTNAKHAKQSMTS